MAAFDPKLWKSRASARYRSAVRSGLDKAEAQYRRDTDVAHIDSLAVLVDWCAQRNIEVNFCKSSGGFYYTSNRQININCRLTPEKQVFFLLHECGHHLIGDKEKHERFGMGYSHQDDPEVNKTFHHRCDIVEEEFEAWHRGFKLGTRIGISIDKESYDKHRVEMLRSYFKWAVKPGEYLR